VRHVLYADGRSERGVEMIDHDPLTRGLGGNSPAKDWMTQMVGRLHPHGCNCNPIGTPHETAHEVVFATLVEYVDYLEERIAEMEKNVRIVSGQGGYIE
jgi:hypothetical protein